uniref:Uncharacterized protein n=1 Tax=Aegilops tauschii subsp. strangulata TaxID=200361 RepID=A0A453T2S9_AEGTS
FLPVSLPLCWPTPPAAPTAVPQVAAGVRTSPRPRLRSCTLSPRRRPLRRRCHSHSHSKRAIPLLAVHGWLPNAPPRSLQPRRPRMPNHGGTST